MKKISLFILCIVELFVLVGCNAATSKDALQILGVNTKYIEKVEIIHNNVILYPDFEQKDNLTIIEDFNTTIKNTSELLENIDDDLNIGLDKVEGYTQNDSENYYVFITFKKPQTLNLATKEYEEFRNCDGILFDINNMRLYLSKDGDFEIAMGYGNNAMMVESEYSAFIHNIKYIMDDLEN